MSEFVKYLSTISKLSGEAKNALTIRLVKKEYPKNHILIPELSKCDKLFFIEKGSVRAFFYEDGKEITDWFGVENMVFGPTVRNFQTKSTPHSVQLLENSIITHIHFSDMEDLYNNFHEIERLGRLIAIQTILLLQHKLDSIQLLNARQRYEDFVEKYPLLLKRAALGHIASYLGMNQVTLSRIRKEK
jgi:signal-transduction protein with cAMP-binding, CBS, and nucleotidyltransferase domain